MALSAAAESETLSAVCQGFIGAGIARGGPAAVPRCQLPGPGPPDEPSGELDHGAELELLMDTANVLIGAFLRGYANQLDTPFSQGHPWWCWASTGPFGISFGPTRAAGRTLAIGSTIGCRAMRCSAISAAALRKIPSPP